jgi:hypothetical protein
VDATIGDTQGKGTINNRKPALSINDVAQNEGNNGTSNMNFTVTPNFIYDAAITVTLTTSDGSAKQPGDYKKLEAEVTIPAGSTSAQKSVNIKGDTLYEVNESFNVNLTNAVGATILDSQGIGTILNDDSP